MKRSHIIPIIWICIHVQTAFCEMPFSVNPADYQYWGTITAVVYNYENIDIIETNDALAAFVNDECRGYEVAKEESSSLGFRFYLQVWSNNDDESLTFQYYDASSDTVIDIQEKYDFNSNMVVGNLDYPSIFHLVDPRPKLANITEQFITEDESLNYELSATDLDDTTLTFSASTTNPSVSTNISGKNLTVEPSSNWHGVADIFVAVTDGQYTDTRQFQLTVFPENDPPEISSIDNQVIYENTTSPAIQFSVSDVDNDSTQVSVNYNNNELIENTGIQLFGDNSKWSLTLTPIENAYGESTITITAFDGIERVDETFLLTVRPLTVQPTLSKIPTVIIKENASSDPIPFTVTDIIYGAENIHLEVASTDPQLVPGESITITHNATTSCLSISPMPDKNGTATITLTASNPKYSVHTIFVVIVKADEMPVFKRFQKLDEMGNLLADSAISFPMVKDLSTGLIWEIKKPGTEIQGNERQYTWYNPDSNTNGGSAGLETTSGDTQFFIDWMNQKAHAGHSDWRLPEIAELIQLVNISENSPHIFSELFPNTRSGCYWAATPHAQFSGDAWALDFADGTNDYITKETNCYVRAVRREPLCSYANTHFVDNQDGTITDLCSGTMWAQSPLDNAMTFNTAVSTCNNLTFANYTDWEIPSRKQLTTLIDYRLYNLALISDLFNQTDHELWTSDMTYQNQQALMVHFYYGHSSLSDLNQLFHVRPVRHGPQEISNCFIIGMPLPGSKWFVTDVMPIQWQSCESVDTVSIFVSHQGGRVDSFEPIILDHPNSGQFNWTVTGPQTPNAMLKIVNSDNSTMVDTLGMFQIQTSPMPELHVSPLTIQIPAKGGDGKVTITNGGEGLLEWQVGLLADWIEPSSNFSGINTGWFSFVVNENTGQARSACFEISATRATSSPQEICVSQSNNEFVDFLKKVNAGDLTETLESAHGCNWVDYNNDGWMDLFVVNRYAKDSLYRNNQNRTFTKVTDNALVRGLTDTTGATWADYDNDGDMDAYVVHPYENNVLYVNQGDGEFDAEADSIVATDPGISYGASWVDINHDGHLDLFVTNMGDEPNALYMNQGNGNFEKKSGSGIPSGHGKALVWADFDLNGWMDLMVPWEAALFMHIDAFSFYRMEYSDLDLKSFERSYQSATWADFDNDTYMDLYLINDLSNNLLLHNDRAGGFEKITDIPPTIDGGNATDSAWADFDNDGDLDLFVSRLYQHNLFYVNNGNYDFMRLETGDIITGHGQACAVADYDNDGDLDLFVARSDNHHLMFENSTTDKHWVAVRCIGKLTNHSAIGAQVSVTALVYGKNLTQVRQITAQTGHSSQDSTTAFFGLGNQSQIDEIKVAWPGGNVTRLQNISSDQILTVVEDMPTEIRLAVTPAYQIVPSISGAVEVKVIAEKNNGDLTWTAHSSSDWLSYSQDIFTNTHNLWVKYKPNEGAQRTGIVSIQAQGISPVTLEIVQKENTPPQFKLPLTSLYMDEDQQTTFSFPIFDTDTPKTDLEIYVTSDNPDLFGPSDFSTTADPLTSNEMTVTLRPNLNQYGECSVSISVADGIHRLTDTIYVVVSPVNDPPEITGLNDLSFHEDETIHTQFEVSDVDHENLLVKVESLTPDKIAMQDIVTQKNKSSFIITAVPIHDAFGTATLKIIASDGIDSNIETINVEIMPINDYPTISSIADQYLHEASIDIPFTIADAESPPDSLTIQAISHMQDVIPDDHIQISGSNHSYTLHVSSVDNMFGVAQIELRVSDGTLTQQSQFPIYVRSGALIPTISSISDQQINEDESIHLTITVGGIASQSISVTGTSSNSTLLLDEHIQIQGVGQERALRIKPLTNANGETIVQLDVSDGNQTVTENFLLTVIPVNDPPWISEVKDIWFVEDKPSHTITFTAYDIDSQPFQLNAISSNDAIIPQDAIHLIYKSKDLWQLTFMPLTDAYGNCSIHIQATDGLTTTEQSFNVVIEGENDSPYIVAIPDQATHEDTPLTIPLSISDAETPLAELDIKVLYDNASLLSQDSFHLTRTSPQFLTIVPLANGFGQANITLSVKDNSGEENSLSQERFVLKVLSVNDPPEISTISTQSVLENSSLSVTFTVFDIEKSIDQLEIQAVSASQTLVPDENLIITGESNTQTLYITPRTDFSGETQIRLSVFDGTTTAFSSFQLSITPLNQPPEFVIGMDINTWEDVSPQHHYGWAKHISPGSPNESDQTLHFLITHNTHPEYFSGMPLVTPSGHLYYTLAENAFGTAQITLELIDDGPLPNTSAPQTFQIIIAPINDMPTFTIDTDRNVTICEDAPLTTYTGWAAPVSPGAANESDQTLTFVLQTSSQQLFAELPKVSASGDLTFQPALNQYGLAQVLIYLKDNSDGLNTSPIQIFNIEILPVLDPPFFGSIPPQNIHEDSALSLDIVVTDPDTQISEIQMTTQASNTNLFPDHSLTVSDRENIKHLYGVPSANQSGMSLITLTVSDGHHVYSDTFTVNVMAVNDPPAISPVNIQQINEDADSTPITLTITDIETPIDQLIITASTQSPDLFSQSDISIAFHSGISVLYVKPQANAWGTGHILLTAHDPGDISAQTQEIITIQVQAQDDPPQMTFNYPQIEIDEDTPGGITFKIDDIDTDLNDIYLTAVSSHPQIIPNTTDSLIISGEDEWKTLHIHPIANANGGLNLTIIAIDAENTVTQMIPVMVNPVNDAPNAKNFILNVSEDRSETSKFQTEDVENDSLSYTILSASYLGTVSLSQGNSFIFSPFTHLYGQDQILYQANDGNLFSNIGTIDIVVSPVNDKPQVKDLTFQVMEDDFLSGYLHATDPDEDILSFKFFNKPYKGSIQLTDDRSGAFYYQPEANINGLDSYTYNVYDGTISSTIARVSIQITPVNDIPKVSPIELFVDEDTSVSGYLTGTDIDNDPLSFEMMIHQGRGSFVLQDDGHYFYTPKKDYNGTDLVLFRAFDGKAFSNMSTINITVNPVNDPPVAMDSNVVLSENQPKQWSLVASDIDNDSLTFKITTRPRYGFISVLSNNQVAYTPTLNFKGIDNFEYIATDGIAISNIAQATVTVIEINDQPLAIHKYVDGLEDHLISSRVSGHDPEGITLTFMVTSFPEHGQLEDFSEETGHYNYSPLPDYFGSDFFCFSTYDNVSYSEPACISITIIPVNDPPVTMPLTFIFDEDEILNEAFTAIDVDGDPLEYEIVSDGRKGYVQLTNNQTGAFTYTPDRNENGIDTILFKVTDGKTHSEAAQVTLVIQSINDAPVALTNHFNILEDNLLTAHLKATDVENHKLHYEIISPTANGHITLINSEAGEFTYLPNANYFGDDQLIFQVTDVMGKTSNTMTIEITVESVNDKPIVSKDSLVISEDNVGRSTLHATDYDSDPLTFQIEQYPSKGRVKILNTASGEYVYTPFANVHGMDAFYFTAYDGMTLAESAMIDIEIIQINDAPSTQNSSVITMEDTPISSNLWASDPDNDSLTYQITRYPYKGQIKLSQSDGAFRYTPDANKNGSDTLTFVVTDGRKTALPSTVTFTIYPVNDSPIASNLFLKTTINAPLTEKFPIIDPDFQDVHIVHVIDLPDKGTLEKQTDRFTYAAFEEGLDSFLYQVNDGSHSSNIGKVTILIGYVDVNPDINMDGQVLINDVILGLKGLSGFNYPETVHLKDVIFGMIILGGM